MVMWLMVMLFMVMGPPETTEITAQQEMQAPQATQEIQGLTDTETTELDTQVPQGTTVQRGTQAIQEIMGTTVHPMLDILVRQVWQVTLGLQEQGATQATLE